MLKHIRVLTRTFGDPRGNNNNSLGINRLPDSILYRQFLMLHKRKIIDIVSWPRKPDIFHTNALVSRGNCNSVIPKNDKENRMRKMLSLSVFKGKVKIGVQWQVLL